MYEKHCQQDPTSPDLCLTDLGIWTSHVKLSLGFSLFCLWVRFVPAMDDAGVPRARATEHVEKSRDHRLDTLFRHHSSHVASASIRARSCIDSHVFDLHRPIYPRPRYPRYCQWRSSICPDSLIRKTFGASSPGTGQRRERRTWKAVGCEEEWRCVSPSLAVP